MNKTMQRAVIISGIAVSSFLFRSPLLEAQNTQPKQNPAYVITPMKGEQKKAEPAPAVQPPAPSANKNSGPVLNTQKKSALPSSNPNSNPGKITPSNPGESVPSNPNKILPSNPRESMSPNPKPATPNVKVIPFNPSPHNTPNKQNSAKSNSSKDQRNSQRVNPNQRAVNPPVHPSIQNPSHSKPPPHSGSRSNPRHSNSSHSMPAHPFEPQDYPRHYRLKMSDPGAKRFGSLPIEEGYREGLRFYGRGDYADGILYFNLRIRAGPDALFWRGFGYFQNGEYALARGDFRTCRSRCTPNDALYWESQYWGALTDLQLGKYANALRHLGQYLSAYPNAPMGLFYYGMASCMLGDYARAFNSLEDAVAVSPIYGDFIANSPQTLAALNWAVIDRLTPYLDANPSDDQALAMLAFAYHNLANDNSFSEADKMEYRKYASDAAFEAQRLNPANVLAGKLIWG